MSLAWRWFTGFLKETAHWSLSQNYGFHRVPFLSAMLTSLVSAKVMLATPVGMAFSEF